MYSHGLIKGGSGTIIKVSSLISHLQENHKDVLCLLPLTHQFRRDKKDQHRQRKKREMKEKRRYCIMNVTS